MPAFPAHTLRRDRLLDSSFTLLHAVSYLVHHENAICLRFSSDRAFCPFVWLLRCTPASITLPILANPLSFKFLMTFSLLFTSIKEQVLSLFLN